MGWLTYFTIRYKKDHGISDLSAVIGALGGGAVLHLFSKESGMFSLYEIGLAAGFFGYVVILLLIALCTHKAADSCRRDQIKQSFYEWLVNLESLSVGRHNNKACRRVRGDCTYLVETAAAPESHHRLIRRAPSIA